MPPSLAIVNTVPYGDRMAEQLGPDAWVERAAAVLGRHGVAAVRVEALARDLGVTKGSFYWHFHDRRALLHSVLEHWEARATSEVIARTEAAARTPGDRLRALVSATFGRDSALDRALRAWATHDAEAAAFVARVDRRRIAYVCELLVGHGVSSAQAEPRARLLYAALLGEQLIFAHRSSKERVAASLYGLEALLRP